MAKKPRQDRRGNGNGDSAKPQRGVKSAAIRRYLIAHKNAKPKEVIAALKEQGISVSANMVSLIRAHAGVRKARRKATEAVAGHDFTANTKLDKASAMEAALTLYKAARGLETNGAKVSQAFLRLVDVLG